MKIGAQLPPERELARLLHVSRPSIREVLKALSILGVVQSRHGHGTFLVGSINTLLGPGRPLFSIQERVDLMEVAEARGSIEPLVASLAARRASQQDLVEIESELQAMRKNMGNPPRCLRHDLQFHMRILKACGNSVLQRMLTPVYEHTFEYQPKLIYTTKRGALLR